MTLIFNITYSCRKIFQHKKTHKDDEVSVDIESKQENEDEKACLRFRKNGQFAIFELGKTPGSPPRFSASGSQANEDDLIKIAEDFFHLDLDLNSDKMSDQEFRQFLEVKLQDRFKAMLLEDIKIF